MIFPPTLEKKLYNALFTDINDLLCDFTEVNHLPADFTEANDLPSGSSNEPFGAGNIFSHLAQPVYRMWIIYEPKTLVLWNKLQFEEKITWSIYYD